MITNGKTMSVLPIYRTIEIYRSIQWFSNNNYKEKQTMVEKEQSDYKSRNYQKKVSCIEQKNN